MAPALRAAVSAAHPQDVYEVATTDLGAWGAANPAQKLIAGFSPSGLEVSGASGNESAWKLELELQSWGRGCSLIPAQRGECFAEGRILQIDRGGLGEWFVNERRGIGHGFLVDAAPPCTSAEQDEPLRLVLGVGRGLAFTILPGARDVRFDEEEGAARVSYTGLRAWDASGAELEASFERDGPRLSIEVEDAGALYPLTIDPWVWTQQTELNATDGASGDVFGNSVCLYGDTALVGACWDDDGGANSGSAYVFVRSGTSWSEEAKLAAGDAAAGDVFGRSVAISGDTALIGAQGDDDDGNSSGSAYVFVRSGTVWSQQAKLTGGDSVANDYFGVQVSLDGDTALIGATGDDDGGVDSGSSYVFVRTGTVWSQQAKLTASDGAQEDNFGIAVSVEGDTALVGSFRDDDDGADSGSAYVFVRSGSTWSQEQKLTADDATAGDRLGCAVSIDHDGDRALIGASGDDPGGGYQSGSAYTFTRSGSTWSQEAKLVQPDADVHDQFGGAVSLDGAQALISMFKANVGAWDSGAAYVYRCYGGSWYEEAMLAASDGGFEDEFGITLCLSGDTALVGAPGHEGLGGDAGAAYVFTGAYTPVYSSETTRLGTPPNPNAFLPGLTSGPVIGATWDPIVTSFHPGAFVDFVGVDFNGPINVPTQWGRLLIWPPPGDQLFFHVPAGTAFSLAVPNDPTLVGIAAWSQGGSVSAGPTVAFANGLDLVFGAD